MGGMDVCTDTWFKYAGSRLIGQKSAWRLIVTITCCVNNPKLDIVTNQYTLYTGN